jgi:outer membrane protein OmpA-like peptidoglycan-associated protein
MSLITDLISTFDKRSLGGIADALGESEQTVSRGMQSTVATVLGGMASKSDNSSLLRKILDMAPSGTGETSWSNLAGNIADSNSPLMSTGKGILSTLFGGSEGMLTRALSTGTGLQPGITSTLLTIAAPMVMGFLGKRVRDQGLSMGGLGNLLQGEIPAIRGILPPAVTDLLWPREHERIAASPVVAAQTATRERSSLRWLLPLMLLALITLWWLSRANKPVVEIPTGAANRVVPENPEIPKPALPKSVDLYFETGSSKLRPDSFAKLQEFAAALPTSGDPHVMVSGYTDNVGSAASNMRLSEARANAVKADLERKGIAADRLTAQGLGDENPIADNSTAQGRETNRRVTVEVGSH